MAVHSKPYLSPQDYLAIERASETKSEYLDGEMVAMAGASRWHNLIVLNVGAELRAQLKQRPCEVYSNDQRVQILATGLYTYPDVVVSCAEPRFEDDEMDTLLNPTVIVEVLSSSTEGYDRGTKFEHYRTLESLAEYLLVSQDKHLVEQFVRQEAGAWRFTAASGLASVVDLPSIGCTLALSEVYDKVTLP